MKYWYVVLSAVFLTTKVTAQKLVELQPYTNDTCTEPTKVSKGSTPFLRMIEGVCFDASYPDNTVIESYLPTCEGNVAKIQSFTTPDCSGDGMVTLKNNECGKFQGGDIKAKCHDAAEGSVVIRLFEANSTESCRSRDTEKQSPYGFAVYEPEFGCSHNDGDSWYTKVECNAAGDAFNLTRFTDGNCTTKLETVDSFTSCSIDNFWVECIKSFNLTTSEPTTSDPTTADPTTSDPTTADPTTSDPTTADPTTSVPTTADPTTSDPTTEAPFTGTATQAPFTSTVTRVVIGMLWLSQLYYG